MDIMEGVATRAAELGIVRPGDGRAEIDLGRRLLADALESLAWLFSCRLAFAYVVDGGGFAAATQLHCAAGSERTEAGALIALLRQLEPIDPFSPRRAAGCRAAVMSAGDVGGDGAYARSLHAQHLRRHGYGAPLAAYLRHDGRIAAGVTLLRESGAPPFDPPAVRLLRQLQPLLEHGFGFATEPRVVDCSPLATPLTARQAEIAQLVAGGASNAEIAAALCVSEVTVKTHLTKIYVKRGVRSRTQLAVAMRDVA